MPTIPEAACAGENAHALFAGSPLHAKVTGLLNPFCGEMVIVNEAVAPAVTVALGGESAMEKSPAPGAAALTVNVTMVEWTRLPLVPVMVSG
jgi:hypothetical protein